MDKSKERPSRRKRVAAGISIVLAVAILLGGTYAWQSMNEIGSSAAKGEPGPAGGRLHDDWEVVGANYGIAEWSDNLTANKDIYVENYESDGLDNNGDPDASEAGRDIFVRVKLYEYMEIGEGATLEPDDPDYAARAAQPLIAGASRDDRSTWSPRVPGSDMASDQFRARWNWSFGGQKTYMPTFNKDSHSQETDIKGDAIDPNDPLTSGEPMNETKRGGTNAYAYPSASGDPDAGTHDYFDTVTTWQAPEKVWDETLNGGLGDHDIGDTPVEHMAKTTESGSVITMAQWKTSPYNSQKGNYWVIDTDGWCYWANPIAPETATGLLLDSITLQGEPDDEWYYCVYVKSQAATGGDWMEGTEGNGFYGEYVRACGK